MISVYCKVCICSILFVFLTLDYRSILCSVWVILTGKNFNIFIYYTLVHKEHDNSPRFPNGEQTKQRIRNTRSIPIFFCTFNLKISYSMPPKYDIKKHQERVCVYISCNYNDEDLIIPCTFREYVSSIQNAINGASF